MDRISAFRLTLLASVVVITLSASVVVILGGTAQAAPYLAFIAPTLVALTALLRVEQNTQLTTDLHAENKANLLENKQAIEQLQNATLQTIARQDISIEKAAELAAQLAVKQKTP